MSRIEVVRRCFNCGQLLQAEDPNGPGFISPETFNKYGPDSVLLCNKCYHEARYNIAPKGAEVTDDLITIVEDAKASDSLVVYFVDSFSFEASFPPELVSALEGVRMMVCANKRDLLPQISDENLREYIAHRFRASKLSVKSQDVILTNLNSTSDVTLLKEEILARREFHDVYLIGSKNAGKTAFRDAFLRSYSNSSNRPVETALYPRTQVPSMSVPLDNSTSLYDFPGMPLNNDIRGVCEKIWKKIHPTGRIAPKKFSMSSKSLFTIEGLALVELQEGKKTDIALYIRNDLAIRRGSADSLAASFFRRLRDGRVKVYDPDFKQASDFDAFSIHVEESGSRDIGIEGLGWFNFEAGNQTFRIMVPKGVSVYTSRAKITKK